MLPRRLPIALFVAVLFLSSAHNAYSQGNTPADLAPSSQSQPQVKLLKALLDEIRQLRGELKISNLLQRHSSLILERVRRQADLIFRLERELQELREDMRELSNKGRYDDQNDDLKQVSAELAITSDPVQRADYTLEYERINRSLDRRKKADSEELDRKHELELKLEERIRLEKATLLVLESQLEAFERDVDTQTSEILKTFGPKQ